MLQTGVAPPSAGRGGDRGPRPAAARRVHGGARRRPAGAAVRAVGGPAVPRRQRRRRSLQRLLGESCKGRRCLAPAGSTAWRQQSMPSLKWRPPFLLPDVQAGFNTQFAWSLAQLATLHYVWPFDSSNPALAGLAGSAGDGGNSSQLATALSSLITQDTLSQAVAVPYLPQSLPPDYTPNISEPAWQGLFAQGATATGLLSLSCRCDIQAMTWAAWLQQTPSMSHRPASVPSYSARRETPSMPPASHLATMQTLHPCCRWGRALGTAAASQPARLEAHACHQTALTLWPAAGPAGCTPECPQRRRCRGGMECQRSHWYHHLAVH